MRSLQGFHIIQMKLASEIDYKKLGRVHLYLQKLHHTFFDNKVSKTADRMKNFILAVGEGTAIERENK